MKLQNSKQRADVKSNQKKRPTYKGMMRILTSGFLKRQKIVVIGIKLLFQVVTVFTVMLEYLIGDALLTDKNKMYSTNKLFKAEREKICRLSDNQI